MLLLLLAGVPAACLPRGTPRDADATAPTEASAESASTPEGEWRVGVVPYLYQTDPAWAEQPYAGGTVASSGCGPTCLSMAYVALTGGRDRDPAAMARFSEEGGYVEGGLTAWRLMVEGAAALGLSSREVAADAGAVADELAAGRVVIASVGPGDFTSEGHFIVIAGEEGGRLCVHDPNSPERSGRPWDADRVVFQCRAIWSLGVRRVSWSAVSLWHSALLVSRGAARGVRGDLAVVDG